MQPHALLARHQTSLTLLALFAWTAETAWRLPGDACYDLLNYHLYGPYALLHGVWSRDIVPAQSQGFLPPTNDLFFYLVSRHLGGAHLVNLVLALPAVVALWLAYLIAAHLLRASSVADRLVALLAVIVGATGAASHPVLATSMSDMAPCSLVLGAMLILLRRARGIADGQPYAIAWDLVPGLLVGAALGLKLTFTSTAVGLAAGVLAYAGLPALVRARMAMLFCIGVVAGLLASDTWWWWRVWQATGNPLFPLYNNIFHSPLAANADYIDRRFLPRDLAHWLFYPFFWAASPTPLVTEPDQPMRDPRFALAILSAAVLLVRSALRTNTLDGAARLACVAFAVGFVLWERQFSIFRYLSVLELLSGTIVALLACSLVPDRRWVIVGLLVLLAGLRLVTVYPRWGRVDGPGGPALQVDVRPLPPGSLVLLLDSAPLAYLAAFEPEQVRFAGADNNVTRPGDGGVLQARIRDAVARQPSNLYGVEKPDWDPGAADRTLSAYDLRRGRCERVTGRIVGTKTLLCELQPSSARR